MEAIHITAFEDYITTIVCPSATPEAQSFFSVNFGILPRFHPYIANFLVFDMMDALHDLFNNRLAKESVNKLRYFSERLFGCGGVGEEAREELHTSFTLKDVSTKGKLWLYKYTSYDHTSSYDDSAAFQPYSDLLVALYCLYRSMSDFFADRSREDVSAYFLVTLQETPQQ